MMWHIDKEAAIFLGAGRALLLQPSQVLQLPGVVPEASGQAGRIHEDWPLIERVLTQALERLLLRAVSAGAGWVGAARRCGDGRRPRDLRPGDVGRSGDIGCASDVGQA